MREDRPLDALLPELGGTPGLSVGSDDAGPAFHPGVLTVETDDGYEWAFACWRDPGGAASLAVELGRFMEAVLLAKMSEPASAGTGDKPFAGVRLFLYDEVVDADAALAELGFREVPSAPDQFAERLRTFADEAKASGWTVASSPASIWYAPIVRPTAELDERAETIDEEMRRTLGDTVWGDEPGLFSKTLAEQLQLRFKTGITPTLEGLDKMDLLLVDHAERTVRWIPPMVFQGLCDFLAVIAHASGKTQVQWAVSETRDGWTSPPVVRIRRGTDNVDIPIGRRLLYWTVMPQGAGTDSPLKQRFGEAFGLLTR